MYISTHVAYTLPRTGARKTDTPRALQLTHRRLLIRARHEKVNSHGLTLSRSPRGLISISIFSSLPARARRHMDTPFQRGAAQGASPFQSICPTSIRPTRCKHITEGLARTDAHIYIYILYTVCVSRSCGNANFACGGIWGFGQPDLSECGLTRDWTSCRPGVATLRKRLDGLRLRFSGPVLSSFIFARSFEI